MSSEYPYTSFQSCKALFETPCICTHVCMCYANFILLLERYIAVYLISSVQRSMWYSVQRIAYSKTCWLPNRLFQLMYALPAGGDNSKLPEIFWNQHKHPHSRGHNKRKVRHIYKGKQYFLLSCTYLELNSVRNLSYSIFKPREVRRDCIYKSGFFKVVVLRPRIPYAQHASWDKHQYCLCERQTNKLTN
jgi:hypothetical protein